MRVATGVIVQGYSPWDGVQGLTIHAAGIGRVEPGQYVLCSEDRAERHVLPSWHVPTAQDSRAETLDILLAPERARYLGGAVSLSVSGPYGKAFQLNWRARRALVIDGGLPGGSLLSLVHHLVEHSLEVTYVAATGEKRMAVPARALPPEIEYRSAEHSGSARDDPWLTAIESLALWPDGIYLAAAPAQLRAVTNVLRRRLLQLRRGFAQALLAPEVLPCGVGACDLCTVDTHDGMRRPCRDGLVFDLLGVI